MMALPSLRRCTTLSLIALGHLSLLNLLAPTFASTVHLLTPHANTNAPTLHSTTTAGTCLDFSYSIGDPQHNSVQFPHLIVPVSPANPSTSYGSIYSPNISSALYVLYAFDIPSTYAGLKCTVLFGLPEPDQLDTWTTYTEVNAPGVIELIALRQGDIEASVTFDDVAEQLAGVAPMGVITGHGTTNVTSEGMCPAGSRVAFALHVPEGSGYGLAYFQDYNPCALGLYLIPA